MLSAHRVQKERGMTIGRRQLAVGARSLGEAECRRPAKIEAVTDRGAVTVASLPRCSA
jgi:hypothetical protein